MRHSIADFDAGPKSASGRSDSFLPSPFLANNLGSSITDLSTASAANRNTTISCSVIQPEAVVLGVPKTVGYEHHQLRVRWRHWRLFEQEIRRPRFACGRRYGITGSPSTVRVIL